jgi:hypothetical protein
MSQDHACHVFSAHSTIRTVEIIHICGQPNHQPDIWAALQHVLPLDLMKNVDSNVLKVQIVLAMSMAKQISLG